MLKQTYICVGCDLSWQEELQSLSEVRCAKCQQPAKTLAALRADLTSKPPTDRTLKLRDLNDRLRLTGEGGEIVISPGIQAKGEAFVDQAMAALKALDFGSDELRTNERYFAVIHGLDHTLLFKIDYLDPTRTYEAADPADPANCLRVLTLMLDREAAGFNWDRPLLKNV
jgi:hypothetical protein